MCRAARNSSSCGPGNSKFLRVGVEDCSALAWTRFSRAEIAVNEPIKMIIERDLAITMTDGVKIRADVFRPPTDAKVPVIMSLGPYGKGIAYKDGYGPEWEWLISKHPEILEGSSGTQMVWETVDPERWVPDGYAVIRVDSRGTGRSPAGPIFAERSARLL